MQVYAVQAAVDLCQRRIQVIDVVITQQAVVVVMLQLQVQLARGRRALLEGRVVAEGRIVKIRIETPQQCLRALLEKVAEQFVDRPFERIGTAGQAPVVAPAALGVVREAPVQVGLVVELVVVLGDQFRRAAGVVVGQRQVAEGDIKPVAIGKTEISQIEFAVALAIENRHLYRVQTARKHFLDDEFSLAVDRYPLAGQPYAVAVGYITADHGDGAAVERNALAGEVIFAVAGEQFALVDETRRGLGLVRGLLAVFGRGFLVVDCF